MIAVIIFMLINSTGFYLLFYRENRPKARRRSIVLLLIIFLFFPLFIALISGQAIGIIPESTVSKTIIEFATIFIVFLSFILPGANIKKMLVPAAFVFCFLSTTNMSVNFLVSVVTEPMVDASNMYEIGVQYPILLYANTFLTSLFTIGSCLFAVRFIRKTRDKPPFKIYFPFCLFFLLSTLLIIGCTIELMLTISDSFLVFGIFGIYLCAVQLILFYLYTKLIPGKTDFLPGNFIQFIPHLSKRELELIEAILAGYKSHKELSAFLDISENTVKAHLKSIYKVTGLSGVDSLFLIFHGFNSKSP